MKLLTLTARSPFDSLTGEAHNHRALLGGLARRGVTSHVVSITTGAAHGWRTRGPIAHRAVAPGHFLDAASAELDRIAPDAIMIWGRRELASEVVDIARRRGVPTVHQIRTPALHHVERLGWNGTAAVDADERARMQPLRVADLVLVPSTFMRDYWAARLGVRPEVMYPVIDPRRVRTARRGARCVTFVNPEPGKGLGVFLRLAAELPGVRFLVVEGRWTAARMAQAGVALDQLPNVRIVAHEPDVRRIWARTQVLLVPSLLPEGFGLVVHEAQLNGIPVVASRIAGIPEAANGGGVLIAPPRRCVADWTRVPSATEIRPWIDALVPLVTDRRARAAARRRALAAAVGFPPARIIDDLAARLRRLA